ncbi:MAG: sugar phosphate isomerase/epimerase [Bacteroidota bacterium]
MEILFFCPRWGSAKIPWDEFALRVKSAGFDGIETDIPINIHDREQMLNAMEKNKLLLIAQHWETTDQYFENHLDEYTGRIAFLASAKPLFINSQTGKDYFNFHENKLLIQSAHNIAATMGVPVYHETHRGKFSFAAHITKTFLENDPLLGLTFDVSHWCAVAESLLDDQQEAVVMAIERTKHIHARIGHTQGPQVIDPRSESAQNALQFHLQCWDRIVKEKERKGEPMLTFTMEFGPAPYMMHHPFTGEPFADQWELNIYMMHMLKERYRKNRTL